MSEVNTLNTWLTQLNETVAQLKVNGFEPTPTNARESLANLTAGFVTKVVEVAIVKDFVCSADDYNVPVRVYADDKVSDKPVIIYAHGGGHMAGSVTVYQPICHRIAKHTGCTVVSVDYRLAPENRYPAGINDLRSVLRTIRQELNKRGFRTSNKTVVAGDSAGGAMAATMAIEASAGALDIEGCILIYPSLDYKMRFDSYERNGAGKLLENGKIEWYFNHYFATDADRELASPIDKTIGDNHPATLVIAAEYDPLVDEALAYCEKLKRQDVAVTSLIARDMVHAFLNLEDMVPNSCKRSYDAMKKFVDTI